MLEKATITNTVTDEVVTVLFNPEQYTLNRDINYAQAAIPGLSAPLLQFVNGNMQTLEIELFVDTYEQHANGVSRASIAGLFGALPDPSPVPGLPAPVGTGGPAVSVSQQSDVRELTNKIVNLMDIEPTTHAPPVLLFTWGSLSFDCVLARASTQFVMFRQDGVPVRARLEVTFNEYRNLEQEARELKRETADYAKFHVVRQGDSMPAIAAREYGDPVKWRPIAKANGIVDIRHLEVGSRLRLPRLPYQDPLTGEVYS